MKINSLNEGRCRSAVTDDNTSARLNSSQNLQNKCELFISASNFRNTDVFVCLCWERHSECFGSHRRIFHKEPRPPPPHLFPVCSNRTASTPIFTCDPPEPQLLTRIWKHRIQNVTLSFAVQAVFHQSESLNLHFEVRRVSEVPAHEGEF